MQPSETDGSIVGVMDSFISSIQDIKKFVFSFSLVGVILSVLSVGISVYLMTHAQFFAILDEYNDFGVVLGLFLGVIMVVSSIWFAVGIKQYTMLKMWNSKYDKYAKKMQRLEDTIASEFHLYEEMN